LARVYNLREEVALFSEEHLVHVEHFRNEYFVPELACLSYIFERFSTLDTSMKANGIKNIVVTDKVKAFTGKLDLWIRKLEGKFWILSCVGGSVTNNNGFMIGFY
jgi:hypothetical protein